MELNFLEEEVREQNCLFDFIFAQKIFRQKNPYITFLMMPFDAYRAILVDEESLHERQV